jgi:hypothetical protein
MGRVQGKGAFITGASDEARHVTGMQPRADAGGYLKWYDFHL